MHPPEPTKNQTLAHLSTPAYPTARFNSTGHCIHHHSVRLCQVTADKKFKIIRKTCFKCGSAGLMSDGPAGGGGSGAGSRKQTIHGYKKKEWKGREVRGDLLTAGTAAGSGMHDSVTGNTSHKGDGRKKKSENSKKNKHKNARVARETIVQEVESDTSKDSDDSDDDDSSDEEGLEEENGRSKINNGGSNKDFEVSENFDDLFNNNNGTNEKASASTPSATPASTPVRPTRTRLSHSLNYGTSFPINNPLVASSHANNRATLNARDGATAVAPPDWNHDNNNKTIASSRQERSNRNNAISNSSSSNGPKTLSSFSERKDRSRTLSPPKHRDGTTSNSSNENNNKSNNLNNPVTNSSNVYSTFFTPTLPLKKKISIGSLKQKLAMPLTSPLQKKKVHSYSGNGVNGAHHMISGLPMMPLPIHQENGRKNGTGSDTDQDTAKDAKEGINTRGRDNINRNSASYSKEAKQHSRHGGLAALSAIGGGSLRHLPHLHSNHHQQNNQQSKSQVIITPDFSLVADVNNSNDTHHHIAAVTQRSGGGNGSGNGGGGVSVTSASTNTTTTDNHSIPDLHTIHTMPTSNMTNSKNNPYAVSSYYGSGHNHQQQQQQHPYHSYSTASHSSDVPNEIMDPAPTSAKYCATSTGKTSDSSNNNSSSNGTTTSKNNNKGGRPFNTYGYCNFHPEIQLAKKNFKGTWKVVHETCPACALEDMAKRSSTRNDRRRSGGDSKSRSRSRSGGSGSRRSRSGSDTANGYGHERRSSSKSKGRGNNDDRRREKCHAVGENRDDYNDDDIDVGYNEENDHENNRSRSANSGNRRPESRDPHENEKSRRGRETTAIHNGRLLLEGPSATSTSRSKTRDVDDDNDYQRDRRRRSTSKSRSRSKSQGLLRSGIGSRSKSPIPARLSRSIQQNRDGGGSKSRSHAVPSRTSRQSLNRIQPKPRSKSPPVYSNKHRLGIGSRSKSPVPRSLSTTNPINKNVSNRDNGGVHSGDVRGNTSNLGNSIKRVQNQNNRTPGMDNGDKHNNKSKALETNGNDDGNTNVTRNGHSIKNKTNGKTNTTRNETKTPMTESPNGYYNRNDSGSASILSNASPDCNPSGTGPKVTTTSVADKSIPLSPAISETSKPAFSSSYFLRENDCSGLNNDLDLIANEIGLPAKLLRRSYNHKNDDDEDDDNNVKSSPSGSPTPMSTVTTPGSTVTSSSCCSSMRVMSTPPSSTPKKDGMRTKTGTSGKHINVPPIPPPPLATFKSARQIHRDRERLNLLVRSSLKD